MCVFFGRPGNVKYSDPVQLDGKADSTDHLGHTLNQKTSMENDGRRQVYLKDIRNQRAAVLCQPPADHARGAGTHLLGRGILHCWSDKPQKPGPL